MPEEPNKNLLDVAQIFLTYITLGGDIPRTAAALQLDRVVVEQLVTQENWKAKASELNALREGESKDLQVQINRAVNYVQAHRLRTIIDKAVQEIAAKSGDDLIKLLTVNTQFGSEVKTRMLTDLVKAAEAVQAMSQRALGDTAAERPDEAGSQKGSSIALLVLKAMNAAEDVGLDSVQVVRKQLATPPGPQPMRSDESE